MTVGDGPGGELPGRRRELAAAGRRAGDEPLANFRPGLHLGDGGSRAAGAAVHRDWAEDSQGAVDGERRGQAGRPKDADSALIGEEIGGRSRVAAVGRERCGVARACHDDRTGGPGRHAASLLEGRFSGEEHPALGTGVVVGGGLTNRLLQLHGIGELQHGCSDQAKEGDEGEGHDQNLPLLGAVASSLRQHGLVLTVDGEGGRVGHAADSVCRSRVMLGGLARAVAGGLAGRGPSLVTRTSSPAG